ncbi:MAG: hypothetical protein GXO30_03130 [Epsilonproteobacteria bacterium]|nr:hypothetical protein [Campylobacterota bacterium]
MQRKNNFLRASTRGKKSGFAMIMAIAVVVIIATIMAFSISMTTKAGKRTADIYLYEQAVLYSKSAAELALLDIANSNPCTQLNKIYTFDNMFDANVTMKYVYTAPSPCASANDDYFNIMTPEQNGSVLMDIVVSVKEDQNLSLEPIRYFRRSIQKL